MHLIVGLGNPTKQYEGTRHNVGFETIDRIAAENQIRVEEKKHKALYGSGYIEGEKVILAKPQTFMNLSGESVRELSDYYKIPAENIIVIYDDISLDVGRAAPVDIMGLRILFCILEQRYSRESR